MAHAPALSSAPSWGRVRRVTFHVAAALVVLALAAFPPILAGPIVAWLDGETLDSLFGEEGLAIHRVHIEGATLLFWLTLVAMISQFRRPESKPAPLYAAVVAWLVFLPLELTHLVDPFSIIVTTLVVLVLALHPRRWPMDGVQWRRTPLVLAAVGAVPALVYAVLEIRLQLTAPATDPHVEGSHYALMGVLALALIVSALAGATDVPGHRIAAWTVAVITVALAAFFIGHSGHVSAVAAGWGVAMIAWAAAYLWFATQRPESSEDANVSV